MQNLSFLKHVPIGWAIFGMVLTAIAGALGAYQFVLRDVPEIRAGMEGIRKDIRESEARYNVALNQHIEVEQTVRGRMDATLRVLQTNMIAVRQSVEHRKLKPEEMREILSNVHDVSKVQAAELSPPTVSGEPPKVPETVVANFGSIREVFESAFASAEPPASGTTKFFAAAIAAKNAKWEAAGRTIKVTYEGGSAVFEDRSNATPEQLRKQAELLNTFSQSVSRTIFLPAPEVVPHTLKPGEQNERPKIEKLYPRAPGVVHPRDDQSPAIPYLR